MSLNAGQLEDMRHAFVTETVVALKSAMAFALSHYALYHEHPVAKSVHARFP